MVAWPTIILASIGLLIAYRQWVTAHENFKLALFDRRSTVYDAAKELVNVSLSSSIEDSDLVEYLSKTNDAQWLFGNHVAKYLEEQIYGKAVDLQVLQFEKDNPTNNNLQLEAAKNNAMLKKHMYAQYSEMRTIFSPYLKFRHTSPIHALFGWFSNTTER